METTQKISSSTQIMNRPPIPRKAAKVPFVLRPIRFGFNSIGRIFPGIAARLAFKLFTTPRKRANHRRSDKILESARLFEFMYGKYLLKGYEWGSGDKIVLLVHGWESRGTAMRSFVPSLVENGFRVVAFDGPGHGHSSGKRTTLPLFGGAVRAVINYLGGVHSIITHSFGGASTVFALANLDKSIAVENLVLIGVPSSMENIYQNFVNFIHAPKSVAKGFRRIMEAKVGMRLEEAHLSKQYEKLSVGKTLIVHDKQDAVVPFSEAQPVLKHWANTSLLATDGFGHFQLMKSAEVIYKVTEFVSKK